MFTSLTQRGSLPIYLIFSQISTNYIYSPQRCYFLTVTTSLVIIYFLHLPQIFLKYSCIECQITCICICLIAIRKLYILFIIFFLNCSLNSPMGAMIGLHSIIPFFCNIICSCHIQNQFPWQP